MREPDFQIIGYLKRWYLIPRNRYFNIYLHNFVGSDDDRALHDHPWWSLSFLLKGRLSELLENSPMRGIMPFWPYLRSPNHMHRMILDSAEAWTLFITGPVVRDWGFRVLGRPNNWQQHDEFLAENGERS